jgi:hypothetical protein
MLIEELELYKSKIQSKIFSLSQEMGSVALIGGEIEEKCILELFTFLSILSFSESNDAQKEEFLSYIIWKYNLSEVDILPFTFPNVNYISDGFNSSLYYTKSQVDALLGTAGGEQIFPIGTPNVNVAVGGWNVGYVLSGVPVIDALTDLGIQFINPSTSLSLASPTVASVERGATITTINVNRTRSLGSATFASGVYSQPNTTDVLDDLITPNPRTFSGLNITANNTTNIVGGIPVHVLTLTTTYRRNAGDALIDTSLTDIDPIGISFVSPVYFGTMPFASTTNASAIQALSKASLVNSRVRTNLTFNPSGNRIVYAYPSRLGNLSNITFEGFSGNQLSNFVTTPSVPTIMLSFGVNAPSESYNVYVYSIDSSPTTIIASFNS